MCISTGTRLPSRGWKTGQQAYRHVLLFSPKVSILLVSSSQWEFDGEERIGGVVLGGVRFEPGIEQGHGSHSTPSQHPDETEPVLIFKSLTQSGRVLLDVIQVCVGPNDRKGWMSFSIGFTVTHVPWFNHNSLWDRPSPRENRALRVGVMTIWVTIPIPQIHIGPPGQITCMPGQPSRIPAAWVGWESLASIINSLSGLFQCGPSRRHRGGRRPRLGNISVAGFVGMLK